MTTVQLPRPTAATMPLLLEVTDPNVIAYLSTFEDDQVRRDKANEALKVGVIAIRSASPTLDTTVVQSTFSDLELRMKDYLDEFMTAVRDDLANYFKDQDGVVPKSINGIFGEDGRLGRIFQGYFDPVTGRLGKLMQDQVGPRSVFGKALDPRNKEGILTQIEQRVQELVEAKLDEVVGEFSFDNEQSAICRLQKLLTDAFAQIHKSLGIKTATAVEIERGHVKGMDFEASLYESFADMGRTFGDETENVRGIPGAMRKKTGDYVAVLGETTGAPGETVVVEVKNQAYKFKQAIDELQEAKKNRQAAIGIFVFAKGCEPREVGDFRRVGEDYFCTVDKAALDQHDPLLYFEAAYQVARTMAVASARQASSGAVDLQRIRDNTDALIESTARIGEVVTKARTVKSSGEAMEKLAEQLRRDFRTRLQDMLDALQGRSNADVGNRIQLEE